MFRIAAVGAADVDASHPLYQKLARQHHYLRDPLLDLRDDVDFDDAIRSLVLEQATASRRLSSVSTLVNDEEGQRSSPPSLPLPPTDRKAVHQKRWRLSWPILRRSRNMSRKDS